MHHETAYAPRDALELEGGACWPSIGGRFCGSREKVVVNGPIHPVFWIVFILCLAPDAVPAYFDSDRAGEDWFQNFADDHRNPIEWRSLIASWYLNVRGLADLYDVIRSETFFKAFQFIDVGGDFA